MGTDDVRFFCYFDGDFIDEDTNFKYNGGKTKLIKVPKSIGFSSFKQKIQEMTKLPVNGTELKIKCGVPADESTVIAVDVDDDESLQSVMEDSKYVRTYILKDVLPATTFTAAQSEDPILLLSATQSQSKIPIDGPSNTPVKMNMTGVKTPGDHGMIKKKAPSSTEDKLTEWFPEKSVSSVTGFENPLGDGNCGFRALCMALGENENEWAWMRGKLLKQIESNNNSYNDLFGIEETSGLVLGISHFEGPAPGSKWMDMPYTGYVFAQEFKVVLVHFSKRRRNCWTFIPFLSQANVDVNVKVIGIGFVENHKHYVKLELRDDCPLPPIPILHKPIHPVIAASWKRLLEPRFDAFIEMNVPELQVDKYPGEIVILDGVSQSNVDDHDIWVKLSLAEELLNLSDSNNKGVNSSYLPKSMNSLLRNHEHSEVNMPEKWHIKSNVDDHQIILSRSSHSSTLDEMLYKAYQVSSQVSSCSQSSVPSQLSNPLIRNHQDNEADKGNRQESVFQRKEAIISSHRSAPMPTYDRFPNSNVVPLDKGMTNRSVSNHEVNEGNEDTCLEENGYTCQVFSQSNVDHHDGGIDFSIRAHEHHDDNEVNVPENAVYKENQVTSQMEQNVPPSDIDIGPSDNCFTLGREFPDIHALKNALSDMAVMTGREYKHVRTSPSKLIMKCKAEGCKWSILATCLSNSHAFKVVTYQEVHTCTTRIDSGDKDHPQATARWIFSKMQTNIEKDPEMEPKKIVQEIKEQFGINISYNKAVKAKTRVLEAMRNHHDPIHMLAKELEQNGSVAKAGFTSDGGQYLFWSFQACIGALCNHLRPVVHVGSVKTTLGVMMFAQGVDSDGFHGNLIDVGFGIYYNFREEEKCTIWESYLGWLKEFVLPPTTAAAAAGIPFSIVTDFKETFLTGAVENVLPHLHHFFYPHRFAWVFSEKFKDNNLSDLFLKAGQTFSTEKCESYLQEINTRNKEAYSWLLSSSVGSKSHWAVSFSPNKHVNASYWELGRENWDFESRKKKSIVEIVESSREIVSNYFSERRREGEEAATTTTGLAPAVLREIQWAKALAKYWEVESIDAHNYQVTITSTRYGYQVVVDLEEKSCTCGEFQATEYPCEHALRVIVHFDLDVRNCLSHRQWYSLDTYLKTYAGNLPLSLNIPPTTKRKVGRPKKLRKI